MLLANPPNPHHRQWAPVDLELAGFLWLGETIATCKLGHVTLPLTQPPAWQLSNLSDTCVLICEMRTITVPTAGAIWKIITIK